MIALDTNVLLRILTPSDTGLAERAMVTISREPCFISNVVVLELMQVLDRVYGATTDALLRTMQMLLNIDHLVFEDEAALHRAAACMQQGMEYSDALVLASATASDALATFDRQFVRSAKKTGARPEVRLVSAGASLTAALIY